MAARDIMPWIAAGEQHPIPMHFPLAAAQTFNEGDVVRVQAAGTLIESATDPADADIIGIAAERGDTTNADNLGQYRTPFGQFVDGDVAVANDPIAVWMPSPTRRWRTRNFTVAGAAFGDVAPVATDIGDELGLALIGGVWGLDQAAANNICRVSDVLDRLGISITLSGGAGVEVVFVIGSHQMLTLGALDAPT